MGWDENFLGLGWDGTGMEYGWDAFGMIPGYRKGKNRGMNPKTILSTLTLFDYDESHNKLYAHLSVPISWCVWELWCGVFESGMANGCPVSQGPILRSWVPREKFSSPT